MYGLGILHVNQVLQQCEAMHLQSEISACSAVPASGSDRILSYACLLKFKRYYKVEILFRIPSPLSLVLILST